MSYLFKLRILKTRRGNALWRWYRRRRGERIGNYHMLPELIARHAPGRSFLDVGCMWGVNGAYSFHAESSGAASVAGMDVFGPTPEFERTAAERGSKIRFILGDITSPTTLAETGQHEVVLCAGVLYHHPAPFDILVGLRRACSETLILRTSTIPEMRSLKGMAIFWPLLPDKHRRRWDLAKLGVPRQVGITEAYEPDAGYGNWFWGLTPTALRALLWLAGFDVVEAYTEPFAEMYVCRVAREPFENYMPTADEARAWAREISEAGIARPA